MGDTHTHTHTHIVRTTFDAVLPFVPFSSPFCAYSLLCSCSFFCSFAASPVTEKEFKMFKQAMGEQGLTKSSTKDVSFSLRVCIQTPHIAALLV